MRQVTSLVFGLALAMEALGFGCTIAIGLGEANQVDTVSIPFTATATLETEEHNITGQRCSVAWMRVKAARTSYPR
jgi:hypothetical protein